MNNLELYEKVRAVPEHAQKQFNNGSFSGTDINPMWRIKTLTEQFGPCGIGWYYEVLSERAETYGETVMAIVDLALYVKSDGEWSKPIYGTGGNCLVKATSKGTKPSDEGYKMALTDALSVACKALGIGADVYFEKDVTKYTANNIQPEPMAEDDIQNPQNEAEINAWRAAHRPMDFDPLKAISKKAQELGLTAEVFNTCRRSLIKAGKLKYLTNAVLTQADVDEIGETIRKEIIDGGLQT
jgi:hypothetical protein